MKVHRTLSRQLLLSLLRSMILSVMAVNGVGHLLSFLVGEQLIRHFIYVCQIITLAVVVALFYRSVDRLILRRLQTLSDAMSEVAQGSYDICVADDGSDELSRLTDSFNRMTGELRANAFLSRDFARYISHEFKTPLAVIRNYAEITQEDASPAEVRQNMDVIMAETDRLTGLSKDILELCRLDSTTIIEKKDRFSPAAQIRSIVLDLQQLWGEKGIEVVPELEPFEIVGNEALLYRVWQNLIGNAIKFTGENGHIGITLRREGERLVCSVADDGIGIPEADKPHIFTPFYSGNRFRNKEGNGLGLSLSLRIAQKLGGTITFESEEGKGSVFTVDLPLA